VKKPKEPLPPDAPRSTAEEILAAIDMAKKEERSVEVRGLDMGQVRKLLTNLRYAFQESRNGKTIVLDFPQRDERGKPLPPGTKPKYQIHIH